MDALQDGSGTDTLRFDGSNNVEVPNGGIDIGGVDVSAAAGEIHVANELAFNNNAVSIERGGRSAGTSSLTLDTYNDILMYAENGVGNLAWFRSDGDVEVPNGDLDMSANEIHSVAKLNITNTSSNTQIADFAETGVTLHQPLSVEANGAMSVANGLELTDTSSNTIDSYSTLYLKTSSGSPSDIVLEPTGNVGISADLDMAGNNVTNFFDTTACTDYVKRVFKNGSYACGTDDGGGTGGSQNLSQVLARGNVANTSIDVQDNNITNSNGNNVSIGDSLKVYGNLWTQGADLAEKYRSPQNLEQGQVVAISRKMDDAVERTDEEFQDTVMGVVSSDPSHVMNMDEDGYPIALEGKAPVKVTVTNGPIKRGDRLVPSDDPGVAMTCELIDPAESDKPVRVILAHNQQCRDATFGRALENSDNDGTVLARIGGS